CRGLKEVPDLSRFRRLTYLWLNNNKLTFLINNYCLTELYLNNNELMDIAGALKQFSSLRILLLHNNQLKNLETTVKELKDMISLRTLNLFNNPLSQDSRYHLYVIYHLPSVQLLDRKGKLDNLHLFYSFCRVPFESPEDAVFVRAMKRSTMQFSSVDWNKISTCHEKRLENKPEEPQERLTIKFR
uniref:Leucine rich repeat containing 72 n=1 Tax=Sphenodon punctatus TaxID=8508 RepID=A0A8D0H154_SPHPU